MVPFGATRYAVPPSTASPGIHWRPTGGCAFVSTVQPACILARPTERATPSARTTTRRGAAIRSRSPTSSTTPSADCACLSSSPANGARRTTRRATVSTVTS